MTRNDFYRDKSILLTGGSGFLASSLVEALADTKCHVRRLSRQGFSLSPAVGDVSIEDVRCDVTDMAIWDRVLEDIDIVFHFAAQTNVYTANEDPSADFTVNVLPMLNMLESCRKRGRRPAVLFAGTVTEAGMTPVIPVDENHRDHPVTVYDLHKLMAENYLKYYAGQGTVQGATLRMANVYGPGPQSSGAGRGLLNSMVRKALMGETLTVYGSGGYMRDYVYVKDVVEAFLAAGPAIAVLNGGHFIIGSGEGHSIDEAAKLVAERVKEKFGRVVPVIHVDPPSGLSPVEARNFVADTKAFSRATGWKASTPLREGIDLTIDYFVNISKVSA